MNSNSYFNAENAAQKASAWLSMIRGKTAPRPNLVLDPERCALVVIDMLAYFIDKSGRCHLPAGAAIVPNIKALLNCWRGNGGWIIFTRHGHQGPGDLGMLGKFFSDYIRADEPQSAIVEALTPHTGELVFRKNTYDAFLGTELQEVLSRAGRTQVLLTGVLTHMCVETTARSAFCRGFEVYVPVDAVATSDEEHHVSSLVNMADSVAVMLDTKEVLEACGANG